MANKSCTGSGTLVTIDGRSFCVGEKIISKNPRSKFYVGRKKRNKTTVKRTNRQRKQKGTKKAK